MAKSLPQSVRDVLQDKAYGHLVTYNRDGSAQVTMVWVDAEGDEVLVNSEAKRLKVKNLQCDPRYPLGARSEQPPGQLIIRGEATVTQAGARDHIDKLAKRYLGSTSTGSTSRAMCVS